MALVSHLNQETESDMADILRLACLIERAPVIVMRFLTSRHVMEVETISLNAVALALATLQ